MTHHPSRDRLDCTPSVELIYDATCPNVDSCRAALRTALADAWLAPTWLEWDRSDRATPVGYRAFGSPTVLVDGQDVATMPDGAAPSGNSCRLYSSEDTGALSGIPSVRSVRSALDAALDRRAVDAAGARQVPSPNATTR